MKFAMIGQQISALLPTLLADLLFAGKQAGTVCVEEKNPAMQQVLECYAKQVIQKSGIECTFLVTADRQCVLEGADCVIYADDPMAASRFRMDWEALSGPEEDEEDPGYTSQCRVNGGIEGLMHTLRAGSCVIKLCEQMHEACPDALVVNLGQPLARICEIFTRQGFRCYGLGKSPLRGSHGIDAMCRQLKHNIHNTDADVAGLPEFAWLLGLREENTQKDILPLLIKKVKDEKLGRLSARWFDWYHAVPVGDVTCHAQYLPEQEDYLPDERPEFGESVEKRKERILFMNTVGEQGIESREGKMAQLLLLSKAPSYRPIQLALALLRNEDTEIQAVTRQNGNELPQLPPTAFVELPLILEHGRCKEHRWNMPDALADICSDVAENNHLAALAALGDRSALRESIETDPALAGLDRIYCQELVEKLIELHSDMIGDK